MPYKDPETRKLYYQKNKEEIGQKRKEYYQKNKKKVYEQNKKYWQKDRERLLQKKREYYQKNKEIRRERDKECRKKNKEKIKQRNNEYVQKNKKKVYEQNKKYWQENRERLLQKKREYYQKNKESILQKRKEYVRKKSKTDPLFKFIKNIRSRICQGIKSSGAIKDTNCEELLGCSFEEAYCYITSLFKEGMSWENHGYRGWHIDHIIPLASFDLNYPEERKKGFHYTNLQPLWAEENFKKRDKILAPHKTINLPQSTSNTPALSETLFSPISLTNT